MAQGAKRKRRRAAKFRLTSPAEASTSGCMALLFGLLAAALSPIVVRPIVGKNWEAEGWTYIAIFSIVTIFTFWRRALGFVEVGADGVAIRKGIRKKFHFYRDIKYISKDPQVGPLGSFILI